MIILINGTVSAGKSTVSKLLQVQLRDCANIEIDRMNAFYDWMDMEEAASRIIRHAAEIIQTIKQQGRTVIATYPLREQDIEYLYTELHEYKPQLHLFTLAPSKEKALENTPDRTLTDWERSRIEHHYRTNLHNPRFGTIIDTTHQSPDETVAIIHGALSRTKKQNNAA